MNLNNDFLDMTPELQITKEKINWISCFKDKKKKNSPQVEKNIFL